MFTTTLNQFAQAADNVVTFPADPEIDTSGVETAANVLAITSGILFILGVVNLVMFIIAIIHLVQNPNVPNRTLWIVLSILIPFAPWVYVLGPRRSFNKTGASASQNPFPQQTPAFSQPQAMQASPAPFQAAPPQQPAAPQPVQPTPQSFAAQPSVTPVTPLTAEQPNVAAPQPQPLAEPVAPITFAQEQPTNNADIAQSLSQEPIQQPPQDRQI